MTARQKIMKAFYPVFSAINKLAGKGNKIIEKAPGAIPTQSIYDLKVKLNSGELVSLSKWKGKKLLLVNTASDCGLTGQYDELQELSEMFRDKLEIIGFPANDFKDQEKGTDEEIAQFCKINYGVQFPLAAKSSVVKGSEQNEVFDWLSNKSRNGWNERAPSWNFSKYLLDEEGHLVYYFEPSVSPLSSEVIAAVEK